VTYGDLRMIRAEFDELMQLSIEAGPSSMRFRTMFTWTRALRDSPNPPQFRFDP